jgi:hypothetical protein
MLRPSTSLEMLWRAKHLPMEHYRFSELGNHAGFGTQTSEDHFGKTYR